MRVLLDLGANLSVKTFYIENLKSIHHESIKTERIACAQAYSLGLPMKQNSHKGSCEFSPSDTMNLTIFDVFGVVLASVCFIIHRACAVGGFRCRIEREGCFYVLLVKSAISV